MVDRYFEVSGIASSVGAQLAYVWCRAGGGDGYTLVGSGHVVGADAILPPGIKAGQFAIAIRLPADGAVETIGVTDDSAAKTWYKVFPSSSARLRSDFDRVRPPLARAL